VDQCRVQTGPVFDWRGMVNSIPLREAALLGCIEIHLSGLRGVSVPETRAG